MPEKQGSREGLSIKKIARDTALGAGAMVLAGGLNAAYVEGNVLEAEQNASVQTFEMLQENLTHAIQNIVNQFKDESIVADVNKQLELQDQLFASMIRYDSAFNYDLHPLAQTTDTMEEQGQRLCDQLNTAILLAEQRATVVKPSDESLLLGAQKLREQYETLLADVR